MAIRTILALALAGGLIQTDLDARALSFAPVTRLIVWPRLPTDLEAFLYLIAVNFEAPDFFEPPSADTLRPARAAEFLYQMVAIDAGDAILCAKISPNATFTDLYKRTALSRSRCFVSVAYNTKNDALCAQLPRSGTFPH